MAVFRNFYRTITTALFALVMCVGLTNVYGAGVQCASSTCFKVLKGTACVVSSSTASSVSCPSGCFCIGSSSEVCPASSTSQLATSCSATSNYGNSIYGGIYRCPNGFGNSSAGAEKSTDCTGTVTFYYNGATAIKSGTQLQYLNGQTSSTKTCNYNTECSAPVTASNLYLNGYTFTGGWGTYPSCNYTTPVNPTASSTTFYACKTPNPYTITLNNGNATENGTSTLYTKYNTGVYLDSNRSQAMTTSSYKITVPKRIYTVFYNGNSGTVGTTTTANTKSTYPFKGYYNSSSGTTQYISSDGFITQTGLNVGKGYTSNGNTWYTQWSSASGVTLPSASRSGYVFKGWYDGTSSSANKIGNAGATYTPTSDITLYAHWTAGITCNPGEYLPANTETCAACPAGSYCPSTSETYFLNTIDQGNTECAAGTYQPNTGQTACIPADAGYHVPDSGATSQTRCGETNFDVIYQDETGQSSCKQCPTLSTTNSPGITVRTDVRSDTNGYWYWSIDGIHNRVDCCRVDIVENDNTGDYVLSCAVCPKDTSGTYGVDSSCSGTTCYATNISCNTGYRKSVNSDSVWAPTVAEMMGKPCVPNDVVVITLDNDGGVGGFDRLYDTGSYLYDNPQFENAYWCSNDQRVNDNCFLAELPTKQGFVFDGYYDGTAQRIAANGNMTNADRYAQYIESDTTWTAHWISTSCPAGQYWAGNACVDCPVGSYSSAGATACTPCPGGYTTSGTNSVSVVSCSVACPNNTGVSAWLTPTWNNDNVENLCKIDECVTPGYTKERGIVDFTSWNASGIKNYGISGGQNATKYGLSDSEWAIEFVSSNSGAIKGKAICSTTSGTYAESGLPSTVGSGQNCWCQATGYQSYTTGNYTNYTPLDALSVFYDDYSTNEYNCADMCSSACANVIRYHNNFSSAVLNAIDPEYYCSQNSYTITYETNGGTLVDGISNPQTYTINDLPLALPTFTDVTKIGSVFDGWYTDSGFANGTKIESITASSVGDKTLYAKWEPSSTTIFLTKKYDDEILGTGQIYTKHDTGVYLDSDFTKSMTTSQNPIVIPERPNSTVTYNPNGGILDVLTNNNTTVNHTFKFYFKGTDEGGIICIDNDGFITQEGLNEAIYYTSPGYIWKSSWDNSKVTLPGVRHTNTNYILDGWYKDSTNVGKPGDQYSNISTDITLKAMWYQTCDEGYYLPAHGNCTICPVGFWCPGDKYLESSGDQGINECDTGLTTQGTGSISISACQVPECPAGQMKPFNGECTNIREADVFATAIESGFFNFLNNYPEDVWGNDLIEKAQNYLQYAGYDDTTFADLFYSTPNRYLLSEDNENVENDYRTSFWYLLHPDSFIANNATVTSMPNQTWSYDYAPNGQNAAVAYSNEMMGYLQSNYPSVYDYELQRVRGLAFCPAGKKVSHNDSHVYENCTEDDPQVAFDITLTGLNHMLEEWCGGPEVQGKNPYYQIVLREIFGHGWAIVINEDVENERGIWLLDYSESNGFVDGGQLFKKNMYMDYPFNINSVVSAALMEYLTVNDCNVGGYTYDDLKDRLNAEYNYEQVLSPLSDVDFTSSTMDTNIFVNFDSGNITYNRIPHHHPSAIEDIDMEIIDNPEYQTLYCEPGQSLTVSGSIYYYSPCEAGSFCNETGPIDWSQPGKKCMSPCPVGSTSFAGATECECEQNETEEYVWNTDLEMCVFPKYEIRYILNGGTLANGIYNPTEYGVAALPLTLPTSSDVTKDGNEFIGWHKQEDLNDSIITEITINDLGDKTLYAEWSGCAVCVEGTGVESGTCSVSVNNNVCEYSATCADGYSTNGGADTGTTAVCTGSSCVCQPRTYTINYDCNGGTGGSAPDGESVAYGQIVTVKPNTCIKQYYEFAGWKMSGEVISGWVPSGTHAGFGGDKEELDPGDTFEYLYHENKTLIALWTLPHCNPSGYLEDGVCKPCPNGYSADIGASSINQCYRSCSLDLGDRDNAMGISGRYYFEAENRCVAESCVPGYHVVSENYNIPFNIVNWKSKGSKYTKHINHDAGTTSYYYVPYCQSKTSSDANLVSIDCSESEFNDLQIGEWEVEFEYGTVRGTSRCDTMDSAAHTYNYINSESGNTCYCQMTEYTPKGQSTRMYSSDIWYTITHYSYDEEHDWCNERCASECAGATMRYSSSSGQIVLNFAGTIGIQQTLTSAICVGDSYTASYSCGEGTGDAPDSVSVNYNDSFVPDANTCMKEGYTFIGWAVPGTDNVIWQPGTEYTWEYTGSKTLTAVWTSCPAGQYLNDGTCLDCPIGSYSAAGATTCTPCQNGTTTSAAGATSCDAACPNTEHVSTWVEAEWTNGSVAVSHLCEPALCVIPGYQKRSIEELITGNISKPGIGSGYRNDYANASQNTTQYNITEDNTWVVEFDYGTVKGGIWCIPFPAPSTGYVCDCTPNGFSIHNNNAYIPIGEHSGYGREFDSAESCKLNCVQQCADDIQNSEEWRTQEFVNNLIQSDNYYCTPVDVNLSYVDSITGDAIDTQPDMCTYGKSFNLPDAETKPGYLFKGWKLRLTQ